MAAYEGPLLLALPDPCLLRVLQCLAVDDVRSLFSAARSHSKLHQAAVVALRSIKAHVSQQQQMDRVMVYLGKHSQHVDRLKLDGAKNFSVQLRQLPQQLHPSSLQLDNLSLQLQPGDGSEGVLGAAAAVAALKQLRLTHCRLLDVGASDALAAALSQVPAVLEHLSINELWETGGPVQFPAGVPQRLQHLTYLELGEVVVAGLDEASPALQPLQALTRLVGLKLEDLQDVVTFSMLSGMQHLTWLELCTEIEPGALAGMTQLQHLCLDSCIVLGGAAGVAQLLSHLQPLQQLTHLSVAHSLLAVEGSNPPAAAYAALTASSKLQHLDVNFCTLPAGVWQHLFPAGRQLPNLQALNISSVRYPSIHCQPPEGSRLVSCCPGLQSLHMWGLRSPELALVQGLSGLQTLHCSWGDATAEVVQGVCQLTGLRELVVWGSVHIKDKGSLLRLTQLQQLTKLQFRFTTGISGPEHLINLSVWAGGGKPVWRQLLQFHLDHPDLGVAQQAAAALAGLQ